MTNKTNKQCNEADAALQRAIDLINAKAKKENWKFNSYMLSRKKTSSL